RSGGRQALAPEAIHGLKNTGPSLLEGFPVGKCAGPRACGKFSSECLQHQWIEREAPESEAVLIEKAGDFVERNVLLARMKGQIAELVQGVEIPRDGEF